MNNPNEDHAVGKMIIGLVCLAVLVAFSYSKTNTEPRRKTKVDKIFERMDQQKKEREEAKVERQKKHEEEVERAMLEVEKQLERKELEEKQREKLRELDEKLRSLGPKQ